MSVLLTTALIAGIFAALANQQYKLAYSNHNIQEKGKPKLAGYYLFVILCAITLFTVTGLRYGVGSDYGAYYWGYPKWESEFAQRWKEWDEPGLPTIAKLLYPISQDGAVFVFVISAITIILFVITIAKNTDNFFFSAVLYISMCWTGCFNGARQFLAAAILFAGHRFIFDRKFIKFCIVVFIASSVHITSLIMLPLYFLITQVLDLKKIVFILITGIAMIYSYDFLFEILGVLKDSEGGGADNNYSQTEINPLRIVIAFAPVILYFFLLFQKKGFTGTENFYMGFVFVRAAVVFGTSNSAYLNRASIFFAPFLCIAINLLINKFPKNQQFLLRAVILILYLFVWIYIEVTGIEWRWVFDRGYEYYNKYA